MRASPNTRLELYNKLTLLIIILDYSNLDLLFLILSVKTDPSS